MLGRLLQAGGEAAAGLVALLRTGVLRPLKPQTVLELTRLALTEGLASDVVLSVHALERPRKPAIVFGDATTTYGELYDRVRRLSAWLDLRPSDAVAIMSGNRPETIEAQAAAMRCGASVSIVNPRLPADAAADLLERVDPEVLVTERTDVAARRVLAPGGTYEDALAASNPRAHRRGRGAGRVVIFTSGTTGRPKGAVRRLEASGATSALGLLRVLPLRHDDVHLTVCPLYHASGSGFTTLALALGNTVVLEEKFSAATFCRAVERHRCTSTVVVPTMLQELADSPEAAIADLRSLRVVVCTGSPLRPDLRAKARRLLGDVVYDLYGATEMGWVSVATPADQRARPDAVGRPVPGVTVHILDAEGREQSRGRRGEIWASNAVAMEGYLDDPELTDRRLRAGMVSVGDLGFLDDAGYLHVVGRVDDMIISGGVNVYPAEVEQALASHPAVREVAAFGVADRKWGQRVVAAVVATGASEQELIDHAKLTVPAAAVPKQIRFVDALPRNEVGKVVRRTLAESQ